MSLKTILKLWERSQNAEARTTIIRSIARRYYFADFLTALPALREAFSSEHEPLVRIAAAEGLALSDPSQAQEYVSFLASVLREKPDQQELLHSINALGHVGPAAAEAIADLLECIRAENREASIAALQALRLIRPTLVWTKPFMDVLEEQLFCSLESWDWYWHQCQASRLVVHILVDMGPDVVTVLIPYQNSPKRLYQLIAATVISRGGWAPRADEVSIEDVKLVHESTDPVAQIIECCRSNQPIDSKDLLALQRLGKRATAAMPAIIARLQPSPLIDEYQREQLALTLALIAPQEPICRQLLKDDDWRVRELTLIGLCQAEDRPEDLVKLIEARIRDEDTSVRLTAAKLLWSSAGQALPAARAILKELPSCPIIGERDHEILDGPPLQWWHREWQELIDPILEMAQSEPSIVEEVSAAWHEHPESINLTRLYWELTQCHEEVIQQCLIKWLARNDLREMVASLELLQRMGPAALSALPALCDLLESDFWLYPFYALQVIASIGLPAAGATGDILRTMQSKREDDPFVRHVLEEAARALGKLLPGVPNLEATLLRVVENQYVRERISQVPANAEFDSDVYRMLGMLAERLGHCS